MFQSPPSIVHKLHDITISKIFPMVSAGQCPPSVVPSTSRVAARRRTAGTTAVGLVCVMAVAACDPGKPAATPSAAPTLSAPSSAATPPSGDAKTLALEAYSGMWKAYAKAGLTANPDEPDLAASATDEALKVLRQGLTAAREKGQIFKGEYVSKPSVVVASPKDNPTSIVIADCIDMTKFLVYKTNGDLANDRPGGRRSAGATVRLRDGSWKVFSFALRERGTC